VYIAGVALILGVVFAVAGAAVLELMRRGDEASPEETLAAFAPVLPALLLAFPAMLLLGAVLLAAIYRAVLRPADSARAYLRLGGDELRLVLVSLILGVLWAVGLLVVLFAAVALYQVAAPVGVLAGLAAIPLLIWVAVRLSFAGPMTFTEGKLNVFGSWTLTRGRFWPLFGAYVLAFVMAILISLLSGVISSALLAVFGGGISALAQADNPDFSQFGPGLALGFGLYALVQLIAAVLQMIIQSAPPAAAYRDITGYGRDTAEVFS
jgi:hypothetical protein